MKICISILLALLLGACAAYSGYGLKPGQDRLDNVLHVMGQPALRWPNADGSEQLAYPRGPSGYHTFMVQIATDGMLQQIENVLDEQHFARIRNGMSQEEVRRLLGPSVPGWTMYFKARDELVWEWRYCDAWNAAARFDVLFDNSKGTVRATLSQTESQRNLCGKGSCVCSH